MTTNSPGFAEGYGGIRAEIVELLNTCPGEFGPQCKCNHDRHVLGNRSAYR